MTEWSRYFRSATRSELIRDYLDFADTGRAESEAATTDVALMNSEGCPVDFQWDLLLKLIHEANTDNALSFIAEEPLDELLMWHMDELIERIEAEAEINPKFARALTRVERHLAVHAIWTRIEKIQNAVSDPLRPWKKPW